MAQRGIKERTWRARMRNSDGIEAVRSHLSKISLNPAMILILSSLIVWPEGSVSYTFDVDFLIALKEEFSARIKANKAGAGFRSQRARGKRRLSLCRRRGRCVRR